MTTQRVMLGLVALWAALTPALAHANVGVPMIVIVMPVMVLSLLPIIAVEAHVLRRALDVPGKRAVKAVVWTNLLSTFIGIPLSWILLVGVQFLVDSGRPHGLETLQGKILSVTVQAPVLMPYNEGAGWMVPAALLVLMVPFFFASWWSEYWLARFLFKDRERPTVWRAVRNANLVSYALLTLWPVGILVLALTR